MQRFTALAEDVESTHGRVRLVRAGRADLVLLTADDLASLEETLVWHQDGLERAAAGESLADGEAGPGLSEAEVRARYSSLLAPRTAHEPS